MSDQTPCLRAIPDTVHERQSPRPKAELFTVCYTQRLAECLRLRLPMHVPVPLPCACVGCVAHELPPKLLEPTDIQDKCKPCDLDAESVNCLMTTYVSQPWQVCIKCVYWMSLQLTRDISQSITHTVHGGRPTLAGTPNIGKAKL